MKKINAFIVAACFFSFGSVIAQPGSLDFTWGGSGMIYTNINNYDTWGEDIAQQTDDKIVVTGGLFDGDWKFTAVRYTPLGLLDTTFGNGGMVVTSMGSPGGESHACAIQPDGKIVSCGQYVSGPSPDSIGGMNVDFVIMRYQSNGDLDSTFGINGIVCNDFGTDQDIANAVAIQADGKILISGEMGDGSIKNFLTVRYTSTGVIDSSFGVNGIAATYLSGVLRAGAITIQPDGKILVAGSGGMIARYNTDGTPDLSFGTSGYAMNFSYYGGSKKIAVQADNKIIYGGTGQGPSGDDLALSRVHINGGPDVTYGLNGMVLFEITPYNDWWRALDLQDNGKCVMAGAAIPDSGIFYFSTARFETDGDIDLTYGDSGRVFTKVGKSDAVVHSMTIQSDGKIIVVGSVTLDGMTQIAVVRYNGGEVSGVPEGNEPRPFRILPNPSSGKIRIEGKSSLDHIEVLSICGQRLLTSPAKGEEYDLGCLPPGLYLVNLFTTDGLISCEKLVIN